MKFYSHFKGYSRFVATLHLTQHPEGRQTCMATYLDGQHVLTSADCCTAPDRMMPLGDLTHGQVWDDINNGHVSHCTGSAPIHGDMARIEGNYCIIYHGMNIFADGNSNTPVTCFDAYSAPCIR